MRRNLINPNPGISGGVFPRNYYAWHFLRLFLAFFAPMSFYHPLPANADTIVLGDKMDNILIDRHAEWMEDRGRKLGIEEIAENPAFHPAGTKGTLNFGINGYSYWIRFTVKNPFPHNLEWVYEMKEARTSLAAIYWRGPSGAWISKTSGDTIPREKREMDLRRPTFLMSTPGNSEQVIYVNSCMIKTGASIQTAGIYSPEQYEHATRFEYLIYGIYYGAMAIMFFYNLFIFISVRDRSYLFYVAYLASMTLFWLNMNGIVYAWLWGPSEYLVINGGAGMVGVSLFWATLFTQSFLNTKKQLPRFNRILNLMYVLVALIVFFYLLDLSVILVPLAYFGAIATIIFLIAGALALRAQFRAARYYLLSWTMFVLGACIYAFKDIGVLPFNTLTIFSAQAGSLLECALLSFALADRINVHQKEKMVALAEAKDELERKVTERTFELTEQKDRVEQATKLKDKFVAIVSHDLRSPLASLGLGLKLLKDDPSMNIKNREYVGKLSSHCNAQIALIDRLLDISRLQTGKIVPNKQPISWHLIDEAYIEPFRALAGQKGIVIHNCLPKEIRLFADPSLFGECVKNVLSNAIKFCRRGDTITVFAQEGRPTTIGIRDTGVGVEPKFIQDLFKHDIQTTTFGTQGEKGTGLGLPYCNDIMQAHDGTISVESEAGKAATFFLSLPEVKLIILAIDDQPAQLGILADILAPLRATILTAENGKEALEILNETVPHLMITDLDMPVMDGLEFIQQARSNGLARNVPIIVLTSDESRPTPNGMDIRSYTLHIGANDFINKSTMANDLVPRITRFLSTMPVAR